jgi:hypothetical protein
MSDLTVLRAQLHAYRDFDECVVIDLQWLDWGTSVKVDVDFVWRDDGDIRTKQDNRRVVSIRFFGVSEVHVVDDLTDMMINDEALLNWGHGEISLLTIEQGTPPRSRLTAHSYKASFRRERYTWIEITFTHWEFSEFLQMAHESPLNID